MSSLVPSALRSMTLLTFLAGVPLVAAMAQTVREHFGDMELSVDATNWRIERPTQELLRIVPIDRMANTAGSVVVTQAASKDLGECDTLARRQLSGFHYDKPKSERTEIGGLVAVAVRAHTRCRNAVPNGIALCIPHRGIGYLLVSRVEGCRTGEGGSPFAGYDWFNDVINGIRFTPQ